MIIGFRFFFFRLLLVLSYALYFWWMGSHPWFLYIRFFFTTIALLMRSLVPGEPTWRSTKCQVAESWDWRHTPGFQLSKRVEGRVGSPGIRLRRGTRRSSLNLHPKNQPREVSLAFGTPLGVGTCHRHLDTQNSPRPGLGSKPPPYSL